MWKFTAPNGALEVRAAGTKGRGVFAAKAFKKGEVIEVAPALRVPKGEEAIFLATFLANYLFATQEDGSVIGLGYTSLYNHSNKPSADFFVNDTIVAIKATRNIKAGEEITLDYGWGDKHYRDFVK